MSGRFSLKGSSRRFELALAITATMIVVPLWATRFLPFTDLPEHVAAIATLAHWTDPTWAVREQYVLAFGQSPYLLYHLVGAALSLPFGSAETGNRILLTLVGFSYPYAVRSVLRALGRDERLALLGGIPFWSRPLVVGFLPYMASVPMLLFTLSWFLGWLYRPSRGRFAALAVSAVVLLLLHLNAFALLGVLAIGFAVLVPELRTRSAVWPRLRALPQRLAWLGPAGLLAAFFMTRLDLARGQHLLRDPGEVNYLPRAILPYEFPVWAHDVWLSHGDEWTAIGFWLLVLMLGLRRSTEARTVLGVLTLWMPFVATALLFVVMPFGVGAGTMLNVRLALFFGVFVLLVLEVPAGPRAVWAQAGALLLTACVAGNAVLEMRRAAAELGHFERLLAAMRPGSRLLGLGFQETSKVSPFFPWIHLGAYHRARGGGVASVSFSELRHWPIRYRPDAEPPTKAEPFWEFNPCLYRNEIDGVYYDYVLTRGNVDPFRDLPPGPAWRRLLRERDFTLYEKVQDAPIVPPWSVADEGPCESRRSLELIGAHPAATAESP